MSARYVPVDRGRGPRAGQLFQHRTDPYRWLVRVYLHRDAKGRKKTKSEVVHGRKRDAEARLIEMLQGKNDKTLKPRTNTTFSELAAEWLKHKTPDVTARTLAGYETVLNVYVLPTLGHRRVTDLTHRDIEALYTNMRTGNLPQPEDGNGWKGKPLGARTVQLAHAAVRQVLARAERDGMIAISPARDVEVKSARPKEKLTLTVAQRVAFLQAADAQEAFYRPLYRFLMDTGLRPGEACALKWSDIDFSEGRISVTKAVTKNSDGQAVIGAPKTIRSSRTVPLFGLADMLLAHQQWQYQHSLDASGHVFTNQNGDMIAPWTMNRRELQRVLDAAGVVGSFTLYNFRHTFATLHLTARPATPLKVVSEWLGHSTIQQTANTYQHVSEELSGDYAERHTAWLEQAERTVLEAPVN